MSIRLQDRQAMNQPADYSDDAPVTQPEDDLLNRAPFAKHLANVVRTVPLSDGLVVGIYGPWGDGKTTVLNLMQSELAKAKDVEVVSYNPWRFTDEQSMLAGFFQMLARVCEAKLTTSGQDVARLCEAVTRYVSIFDPRIENANKVARDASAPTLEQLRAKLRAGLASSDKRIVVLVDDIDRLDGDETHVLFRMIKSCANLPNICYVLAFDDAMVARTLGTRFGGDDAAAGRQFLEKIVQVPLTLPLSLPEDLRRLCFDKLEQALSSAPIILDEEDAAVFRRRFDDAFKFRLKTPRSAKRYGNNVAFAASLLKDDVDPVDLLLIEGLRAFYPDAYGRIRDNLSEFIHDPWTIKLKPTKKSHCQELVDRLMAETTSREKKALTALLAYLFPRTVSEESPDYGAWARGKRICSPQYYERYFTYSVARDDVSEGEVRVLYANAEGGKLDDLEELLSGHLATRAHKRLVERLRNHEDSAKPETAKTLALAIARVSDKIARWQGAFFGEDPFSQAAMCVSNLVKQLEPDQRLDLTSRLIRESTSLLFASECVRWLHVSDEPSRNDMNVLSREQNAQAEQELVKRIGDDANNGLVLFDDPDGGGIRLLFEWATTVSREPVQAYLLNVFETKPSKLETYLEAITPLINSSARATPYRGNLGTRQFASSAKLIEAEKLASLLRAHFGRDFEDAKWERPTGKSVPERLAEQFIFLLQNPDSGHLDP
jgi:predicted KAP-like P-loop ATPase